MARQYPPVVVDVSADDALMVGSWDSAIAMVRRGDRLYTAAADAVAAWEFAGGELLALGERYASPGTLPCHLALTPSGSHLIVAHYDGGFVSVHPVAPDGSLEPPSDVVRLAGSGLDPERQEASHPHMVWCGSDGEVIVVDLGVDLLRRFRLDRGLLVSTSTVALPPGTGPRHLVVVDGLAYVVGELADALIAVDLDSGEVLHVEPCAARGTPPGGPSYPSAIKVSADGRRCHVLRRGPNTIATFLLGAQPRLLGEVVCGGDWPWDLAVAGEWLYVANQRSGTVTVLGTDPSSGLPVPTGRAVPVADAVSLLLTQPERSDPA